VADIHIKLTVLSAACERILTDPRQPSLETLVLCGAFVRA
jgi:hypothetical protein